VILRLTDGQIVQEGQGINSPRVLSFASHDLPIDLPKIEQFRQRGNEDREYFLPELLKIGWNDKYSEQMRNESRASLNYRLVEVVMMVLLPLLAVALAVPPKRSTSSLGVFLSIVMVVAYHKVNQYGQDVASLGRSIRWRCGGRSAVRRADRVDVLAAGLCAGRPADRRAGARLRQAGRRGGQAVRAAPRTRHAGGKRRGDDRCSLSSSRRGR
jgi:hypothetical protein